MGRERKGPEEQKEENKAWNVIFLQSTADGLLRHQ